MAHIGVGAFHRCHQAEYTDDLLRRQFDRWGVVGINIRPPRLAETLGRPRRPLHAADPPGRHIEARVIGSILRVVDSQAGPQPALGVLAAADIELVTMTVTEKGYCHIPSSGAARLAIPAILHDLAEPRQPQACRA